MKLIECIKYMRKYGKRPTYSCKCRLCGKIYYNIQKIGHLGYCSIKCGTNGSSWKKETGKYYPCGVCKKSVWKVPWERKHYKRVFCSKK